MKFFCPATIALAATASIAQATSLCGPSNNDNALIQIGLFKVLHNNWESPGTQCSVVDYTADYSIGFHTRLNIPETTSYETDHYHYPSSHYKTFAATEVQVEAKVIASISSISTTLNHIYTSDGLLVSNVAISLFTGYQSIDAAIMIWTALYGNCEPESTTGKPINTQILVIAGVSFDLYEGYLTDHKVYSFVPKSSMNYYSGDLKLFLNVLVDLKLVSNDHILQKVQGGTHVVAGINAQLTVEKFSVQIL
ncbi:putative glycoside hydrolase family 12, glycoside hydrolase family [Plasmopara halstedii]